jgi:hypothetical protein
MPQGAAKEGFVALPVDGVGKQVRNLQMQIVQPDGTLATVYMQVMGPITDADGRVVDVSGDATNALLVQVVRELRAMRTLLSAQTGSWSAGSDDGDGAFANGLVSTG